MGKFRKHVTLAAEQEDPYPQEGQKIVRVTELRGSNIVEAGCAGLNGGGRAVPHSPRPLRPQVEYPSGNRTLVLIPSKYQKKLWIRRDSYVIVDEATDDVGDHKVTGTIATVLYPGAFAPAGPDVPLITKQPDLLYICR